MHLGEAELRNFLLDAGLVSRAALESAVARAQEENLPLSRVLIESALLTEDEARRAGAHSLGVPFVELNRDNVSIEALALVPEPLARARGIVAFNVSERGVEVALLNLADLEALHFLRPHYKILPRLTARDSMTRALLLYQKYLRDKFGALMEDERQIQDALLLHALNSQASDIVLDCSEEGVLVRYRVGGTLHEAMRLTKEKGAALTRQLKAEAKLFPLEKAQEGRFKIEYDGEQVRVHVHALPTVSGERLSLTLSRGERKGYTLLSLGFHGEALESLHAALLKKEGLLVVAGEPGAGKTTLLYTLLDMLSAPHVAVATVERVVEHRLVHAAQSEVSGEATQASLLRAALRQDPDVVMVAPVAEREVAALAARAASRGVFVLVDIDAPTAAEGLVKLRRLGVDEGLLASTLCAAVGVRAARLLCDKQFADKKRLTRAEADALEAHADFVAVLNALKEEGKVEKATAWKDIEFPRPLPCSECSEGFKGRCALYEVMRATPALKDLLRQGAGAGEILQQAHKDGMLNLAEDGIFKAAVGVVSIGDIFPL